MNVTKAQFKAIEEAIKLLPQGEAFKELPPDVQSIITNADAVLVELNKKRIADNKRTADYIAKKRVFDKDYARKRK